jgi:hypothetical protein
MQLSPRPEKTVRFRIVGIVAVTTFALVIGCFTVSPAVADDHHGGGDHGGAQHHDDRNHGGRGPAYHPPRTDYYYAPQPNYYSVPEPDQYYAPGPEYSAPPQGINLFFGF